jgi:phage tail tape-measure protein
MSPINCEFRETQMTTKQSWLDDKAQTPQIDSYVQKLGTFVDAMADGRIDDKELTAQEQRLVTLMKEVEPALSEAQHAQVTKLLCELTAYNVMQTLNSLQSTRPKTKFRG